MRKPRIFGCFAIIGPSFAWGATATFTPQGPTTVPAGTPVTFDVSISVGTLAAFDAADIVIGSNTVTDIAFSYSASWLAAFASPTPPVLDVGFYTQDVFAGGNNPTAVGTTLPLGTVDIDTAGMLGGQHQISIDHAVDGVSRIALAGLAEAVNGSATFTVEVFAAGDDTCHNSTTGVSTGFPCTTAADCGPGEACGLKSRHISFFPGSIAGADNLVVSFRVEVVSSTDFPGSVGNVYWAGDPVQHAEGPTGGDYFAAALQCAIPAARDWTAQPLVHVQGEAVVPNAAFDVRAATQACIDAGASIDCMSAPLRIETGLWGDIVGPFGRPLDPDFTDINALVDKFKVGSSVPVRSCARGRWIPP